MRCQNCDKIRAAILHGHMAEAAGLTIAVFREKLGFAPDNSATEPGPLDKSIPDLIEYLVGVTDLAHIEALIAAENAGKSRVGALEALEARRDELTGA